MSIATAHPAIERAQKRIPFPERLTCSVKEAVEVTNISRSRIYELIKSGQLETRQQGRRRLISVPGLLRFLEIET
jgi:excisionase family DNA binding protein